MSATASEPDAGWLGRRWRLPSPRAIDIGFAVWVALLLYAMVRFLTWETIPYHIIFVSLAVVYGFRVWSRGVMNLVLAFLTVATGAVLVHRWLNGYIEAEELSEIVLMPMILLAMGWHVRRRAAMQAELAALAAAERDRREREQEFLRDCSHALRTPLTLARGHVELLLESTDPAQQREDAQIVLDELDRMNRLASRLLAIADVERPYALVTRVQDLGALAVAVHTRWSASVDRDWELRADRGVVVMGDAERLQAALDALLENAVRVTEPGQRIRTLCEQVGPRAWLGVEDGGPGFAEGEQALAFDRFWRRPRGSAEETTTGLGLSFVKAVAEAHGGGVYLRPGSSGGSVGFWVPALDSPPQRLPAGAPRSTLRDSEAALEVTGRS
jgi:signal transduction histidine kinase